MSTEAKQYRSPPKTLVRFFKKSRDNWKQKCFNAKQRIRVLQTQVLDVRESRDRWKQEAKELRSEVARLQAELEEEKVIHS